MKKKYYISIIIVFFVLFIIIGSFSYAYFTAIVNGNNLASDNVITTGNMSLLLSDGPLVSGANLLPGSSITKTFSVKNNGSIDTTYDVYLSEIINTFADKNDLVYTVTSSDGGCQTTNPKVVFANSNENSKLVKSCPISSNQTQSYTLTIEFINDDSNQDDNKGRKFSGKISVNSFKEGEYSALDLMINNPNLVDYNSIDGDNNYRFTGVDPSNYVSFNGYDAGWRVVGIFDGYVKLVQITHNDMLAMFDSGVTNLDWDNASGLNSVQNIIDSDYSDLVDNHVWCSGSTSSTPNYQSECLSTTTKKVGILTLNDMSVASDWFFKYYEQNAPVWTFTGDSSQSTKVWIYTTSKTPYSNTASSSAAYFPAVYLKNDVKVRGSGTVEDPYVFYRGERQDYTYASIDSLKSKMTDYSSIDGEGIYRYTGATVNDNYVTFNNERATYRIVGLFGDNIKLVRLKEYTTLENSLMYTSRRNFGSTSDFATSSVKTYLDSLDVNDNDLVINYDFGIGSGSDSSSTTYSQMRSDTINTKVGLIDLYDAQQGEWLQKYTYASPYSWSITKNGDNVIVYGGLSIRSIGPSNGMHANPTVYLSKDIKVRGKGTKAEPYVFVSTKEKVNDIEDKIVVNMSDYSSIDGENIYRFVGDSPNNYVKLSDDSLWRIISVKDGQVKIVKNEGIGARQWNTTSSNDWASSYVASYLNSSNFAYYSNSLLANGNYCISKLPNLSNLSYSSVCLDTWSGKIGIADVYEISQANWLRNIIGNAWSWTITAHSTDLSAVYISRASGFDGDGVVDSVGVVPTMYLKTNLSVSGQGTIDDPYVFSE